MDYVISVSWNRLWPVHKPSSKVKSYVPISLPKLPHLWMPSSAIILLLTETSELA